MLISFVWLYMFKCDVYAQVLADQTQKYFWVFHMFLKVILYFRDFGFFSKCIFVFFFKNWFRGLFTRSSPLIASREMCLREISKSHFHTESLATALQVFQTKLFPQNVFRQNWKFFKFIQRLSQLRASRESFSMSHD